MARFYDSVNDFDLRNVEWALKQGGIEYSMRILQEKPLIKEIMVAEEDLAFAEMLVSGVRQGEPDDSAE